VILSDSAILKAIDDYAIRIEPFDRQNLGGNSYDVHLAETLMTYQRPARRDHDNLPIWGTFAPLDCKMAPTAVEHTIPPEGFVLEPGKLYLGATREWTATYKHVPYVDGRSSVGRMGIRIHATAGRGDVGFEGSFTLEIDVIEPVRIYAGMRIGQLTYHTVEGEVLSPYATKATGSYKDTPHGSKPVPSALWKSFEQKEAKPAYDCMDPDCTGPEDPRHDPPRGSR